MVILNKLVVVVVVVVVVQIPQGKSKYPRQNQSYFAFAVKYLVLP